MQAMKCITKVNSKGKVELPRMQLKPGTSVEVIVLVREQDDTFADLMSASESSLKFWDNPIDDEVWNVA